MYVHLYVACVSAGQKRETEIKSFFVSIVFSWPLYRDLVREKVDGDFCLPVQLLPSCSVRCICRSRKSSQIK